MNRRALLGLVPAGAAVGLAGGVAGQDGNAPRGGPEPAAAARRGLPRLKITDVKTIMTAPDRIRLVVVKVLTSEPGLYGLGCATFTQRALAVQTAVDQYLRPFLIGRDPDEIEDIWQSSYVSSYWRNGPVLFNAMSGVDMALWDIKGKRAGMPVYQLLGGKCRFAAALYAHTSGRDVREVEDRVREAMARGYRHVRVQLGIPGMATYGARVDRANAPETAAIGPDRARSHLGAGTIPPRGPEALRAPPREGRRRRRAPPRRPRASLPARGGQALQGPGAVPPVLRRGPAPPRAERPLPGHPAAVRHAHRDGRAVQHAARIRAAHHQPPHRLRADPHLADRRPERRAKSRGTGGVLRVKTAWHGPGDVSPVGHAAGLALELATHNFGIHEGGTFPERTREVFPGCPETKDGYLYANEVPGLGIDIDEKLAARFPHPASPTFDQSWGTTRRRDGTVIRP